MLLEQPRREEFDVNAKQSVLVGALANNQAVWQGSRETFFEFIAALAGRRRLSKAGEGAGRKSGLFH